MIAHIGHVSVLEVISWAFVHRGNWLADLAAAAPLCWWRGVRLRTARSVARRTRAAPHPGAVANPTTDPT